MTRDKTGPRPPIGAGIFVARHPVKLPSERYGLGKSAPFAIIAGPPVAHDRNFFRNAPRQPPRPRVMHVMNGANPNAPGKQNWTNVSVFVHVSLAQREQ